MWESADTTTTNTLAALNSQLSFYEYPSQKPFINSTHQPLRPSHSLSATVALPESNRDHLLTALQSLSFRIKKLESERERAECNLREMTRNISRIHSRDSFSNINEKKHYPNVNFHEQDDTMSTSNQPIGIERTAKNRVGRKKRKSNRREGYFETGTSLNPDGRHYHLDMNSVPFILGASTSPSHNVKSNVQNVIALLKKHNQQLCLSSKEYAEILNNHGDGHLSPHTFLYLDHFNRPTVRPSSASPIRTVRRSRTSSFGAIHSTTRRPKTAMLSTQQCYARIKSLHQEFATLTREHRRLNTSRGNRRELQIVSERMKIILEDLEKLQNQLKSSMHDSLTKDLASTTKLETPLETLRKTRLIQILLKDSNANSNSEKKEHFRRRTHRRFRPNSYD